MRNKSKGKKQAKGSWLRSRWPEGTTQRILLGLLTAACLFVAAWARVTPQKLDYVEGDIARETIRAPRNGVYVDPDEMDRLRDEAASAVPDVYEPIPDAKKNALTAVSDIFQHFDRVRNDPNLADSFSKVEELENTLAIRLSPQTLQLAVRASTTPTALSRVRVGVEDLIRIEMGKEIRENTPDIDKTKEQIVEAAGGLQLTSAFTEMARDIGKRVVTPTTRLNSTETEKLKQNARDSVADVPHPVQAGAPIILAGDEVRQGHIAAFQAVGLMQATIDYPRALGVLVTATVMVFLLGAFTIRYAPEAYADFGQLVTVAAVLVVTTFAYRAIGPTWFEAGALTFAMATSMIIALLINVPMAIAVGIFEAMVLPVIAGGSDARMVLVVVLATTVGVFAVSRRGSKSKVIAGAAPLMAAWAALLMLVGGEVFAATVGPRMLAVAALGGLASPLLAMGASIALERVLGVTTEYRLVELYNPNEPVLQRLIREAPGSYQSSVMVGNLAEPAAEAIGADGLLVKVAAMYHDIGKIRRPYFFVENQFGEDNPHDRLSPNLSALVIINHVKDGVELANEYGLPPVITSFIAEHQGTTLVKYFYRRAVDQAKESGQEVQEAGFRYPGPKPRSRETALLMLADIVEAAARTLSVPNQQELQDLVGRLIDDHVADGQLDESPLSFRDLATVKRTFVSTLSSMFHQRIKYPEQIIREAEQAQQAAGNANQGARKANGNGRPGEPGNGPKPPQQPRNEKQT